MVFNPTVLAVVNARAKVMSEARFTWRRYADSELFGTSALTLLERPWPGATGSELWTRMDQDASLSGNAFVYRAAIDRLQVLHPNKVEVLSNGREKTGYLYWANGYNNGTPFPIDVEEMAHWAPIPHPEKAWMGAAWLDAVIPEIRSSGQMNFHQETFYKNAATPNLWVEIESRLTPENRELVRTELDRRYAGLENSYKTMVLDGGAKLHAVGADFQQMDYANVLTNTEARIASAGGVPPIIIGLKAGLDSATYSNYHMAMRAFADHTIRPLWDSAVAALQQIITPLDAGFDPDSAVEAIRGFDMSLLVGQHSGLFSVQLQKPGESEESPNGQGAINELENA
jgi:HK97 family phage portal protein